MFVYWAKMADFLVIFSSLNAIYTCFNNNFVILQMCYSREID